MDRAEALAVLDEILEVCKESLIMNSVSLDNPPISAISKGYQIHMMNPLHSDDLVCMNEILRRYGLLLKFEKDLTIIYRR